jgi:hypothetical protein
VKRELIIGCAAIAVFSSCSTASHLGRNELASQSPRAPEIRKALNQTVIPEVNLENVTVEDAMKAWAQASRTHHRLRFRFDFVISPPMLPTQSITQGTPSAVTPTASPQRVSHVTVRRKNITSERLLDEICQQSNYVWTIMGRVIVIKPRGSTAGTPS